MKRSIIALSVLCVMSSSVSAAVLPHEWNSDTSNGSIVSYLLPTETQRYNDALANWKTNGNDWERLQDAFDTLEDTYSHIQMVNPVTLPAKTTPAVVVPVIPPVVNHGVVTDGMHDLDQSWLKAKADYVTQVNQWNTSHDNNQALEDARKTYEAAHTADENTGIRRPDHDIPQESIDPAQSGHSVNPQAVAQVTGVPTPVYSGSTQRGSYEGWVNPAQNPHSDNSESLPQVTAPTETPVYSGTTQRPAYVVTAPMSTITPAHRPEIAVEPTEDIIKLNVSPVIEPLPVHKPEVVIEPQNDVIKIDTVDLTKVIKENTPHVSEVVTEPQEDVIHVTMNPIVIAPPVITQKVPEPITQKVPETPVEKVPAVPVHQTATAHPDTTEAAAQAQEKAAHASRYASMNDPKVSVVPASTMTPAVKPVESVPMTDLKPATQTTKMETLTPAVKPQVTAPVVAPAVIQAAQTNAQEQAVTHKAEPKAEQVAPVVNNYYVQNTYINQDAVTQEEFKKSNRKLSAGIAGAVSIASIPSVAGSTFSMGLGGGNYSSQSSVALGGTYQPVSGVAVKMGVAYDTQHTASIGGGVAVGW